MVDRYDPEDYCGWEPAEEGMFVMHENYAELENQLVLAKAAYEGVSSLLLSVQQDCIEAKKEITLLKAEWQPIKTAPKTPEEIFNATGEWDYQIIVGRTDAPLEDSIFGVKAGCVAEAEWREDGWYSVVEPEMRHIFGDYNKIVDPTHWRPRYKVPK